MGTKTRVLKGDPDPDRISTSYVERQNLSMRMGMRRFTRLTNAFSKKVDNLAAAVGLHYLAYNFAKPHGTLSQGQLPDDPRDGRRALRITFGRWKEIAALLD